MNDYDKLYELMQSGNVDTSVINDLYRDVLEMGDVYLAISPGSCGAPSYCGKYPNECVKTRWGCDCKC